MARANVDDRGGVAIIFGAVLFLLCGFIGAAVDIARYRASADTMQQIADAAALAATAEYSKSGDAQAASRVAQVYLDSNASRLSRVNKLKATTTVDAAENLRIQVLGTVQTTFLGLFGMRSFKLTSVAEAAVNDPHMDLHLLVDVTGSMNIPDTPSEMARFANLFRPYGGTYNCTFACHGTAATELYNGKTGFQVARENNVYLREDRIRDSLVQMIDLLENSSVARGLRIAAYTFQWDITERLPLTSDFDVAKSSMSAITNESGGTDVTNVLSLMNYRISTGGTGKASSPRQAILLLTDGVNGSYGIPAHLDTAKCNDLKAKGIIIYVLNVRYPEISLLQGPSESLDKAVEYRAVIEDAPNRLSACATPGKYWDAYGGDSITQAILEIGEDIGAPRPLRLTQ